VLHLSVSSTATCAEGCWCWPRPHLMREMVVDEVAWGSLTCWIFTAERRHRVSMRRKVPDVSTPPPHFGASRYGGSRDDGASRRQFLDELPGARFCLDHAMATRLTQEGSTRRLVIEWMNEHSRKVPFPLPRSS